MNPDQFAQLLTVLTKLSERTYTLTQAADWPILAAMAVIVSAILGWLIIMGGRMWDDLKATIKEGRQEWKSELAEHKHANGEEHKAIWQAMKDCQGDCCPRGSKE